MAVQQTENTIAAAVGAAPALNRRDDVVKVQTRLNLADANLKADGNCGPLTIAAIKDYQRNFLGAADGRVDPGGITWTHLVAGKFKVKRKSLVLLPQVSGLGYYCYSPASHQYGSPDCIQAVQEVCGQFRRNLPELEIGVGDISLAQGGHMSPHQSHQQGLHLDVRPLRKDKRNSPVTISDPQYSRESTTLLVKSLRAHRNVKSILFNDSQITSVSSWSGHDNHLHVTMKE